MSIMQGGGALNLGIGTLIWYVGQYDPDFLAHIKGAGEGEIAYLERRAGRPLPGTYRQFLQRMGQDAVGWSCSGIAALTSGT